MASDRQPKAAVTPADRQIRTGGDPDETDTAHPAWQFHRWDLDHKLWGWRKLDLKDWIRVLAQLQNIETMTWAEIKRAAGGRSAGTNSHSLDLEDFCAEAKARWTQLRLDDWDVIFSLRLQGKLRIYGIRDGRALKVIWHDPFHGDKGGAYPLKN